MTRLYEKLVGVSRIALEAICLGLALDESEHSAIMEMASDTNCQLRLLHYPSITEEKLRSELLTRLPPHNDWRYVRRSQSFFFFRPLGCLNPNFNNAAQSHFYSRIIMAA
jgi:hypothetical protein